MPQDSIHDDAKTLVAVERVRHASQPHHPVGSAAAWQLRTTFYAAELRAYTDATLGWESQAELIDLVRRCPIDQVIIADRECGEQRVANSAKWSVLFDVQTPFMTAFSRSARQNAY